MSDHRNQHGFRKIRAPYEKISFFSFHLAHSGRQGLQELQQHPNTEDLEGRDSAEIVYYVNWWEQEWISHRQIVRPNDVKLKGNEGGGMIICKEKSVEGPFCLANINTLKNRKLWVDVGPA